MTFATISSWLISFLMNSMMSSKIVGFGQPTVPTSVLFIVRIITARKIPCLADAVRKTMSDQLGKEIKGKISIITHLRTFGYCFNPVSFLFPLERGAYPTDCLNGGNHQHPWGKNTLNVLSGKQAPIQTVAIMNSARNFMYLLSSG